MSAGIEVASSIADRVRVLRDKHTMTQAELGAVLGVDHTAISRIEAGRRGLAMPELARLATHFGVSSDFVLFGEPSDDVLFRAEGDADAVVAFAKEIVDDVEFVEALLA